MRLRFTLGALMGLVILAAVGLAALKGASPLWAGFLFTLDVILFGYATLGAIARRGPARMPWTGFALFGWLYLVIVFGPLVNSAWPLAAPPLLTNFALHRIDRILNPRPITISGTLNGRISTVRATFDGPDSILVGHSLAAVLSAMLGGILGGLSVPRSDRTSDRPES